LGEDGLGIMKQLINNVCEIGERSKVINAFKIIDFNEKPKAANYSDLRTISFIANTAKILGRILKERLKGKLRMYFD
jgi:hypothetical protein